MGRQRSSAPDFRARSPPIQADSIDVREAATFRVLGYARARLDRYVEPLYLLTVYVVEAVCSGSRLKSFWEE
jgi:hypothetical protein